MNIIDSRSTRIQYDVPVPVPRVPARSPGVFYFLPAPCTLARVICFVFVLDVVM